MAPELRKRNKPEKAEESVAKKPVAKAAKPVKRKAPEESSPVALKKQKKPEPSTAAKVKRGKEGISNGSTKPAAPAKSQKKTKQAKPTEPSADDDAASGDEIEQFEADEDDATKALVRTLDDDEQAGSDFDGFGEDDKEDGGAALADLPAIKINKKVKKGLTPAEREEPGVIYVGRIPRGFFEHQLRGYLSQFGNILRLRVSRNKKTGESKNYAFVEFEEASTADVVAQTMNNYLLFGRLLKVQVVPKAQVHPNLFVGANRRFKAVPWNKLAGRALAEPKSESTWDDKIERENKRRAERAEKLKALGYEFEGPTLKNTADAVAQNAIAAAEAAKAVEAGEEVKAIENGSAEKTAEAPAEADKGAAEEKAADEEVAVEAPVKKGKKGSKKKATKA